MEEKKETKMEKRREEEPFAIQNQSVNLEGEEENPGIGYEIVIGSS